LIEDVVNISKSYLTYEEQIYISREWDKFDIYCIGDITSTNGWIDLLVWAQYKVSFNPQKMCRNATRNNHLEILKWIKKNLPSSLNYDFINDACNCAILYGNLEILKWTQENGCKLINKNIYNKNLNSCLTE